MRLTTITPSPRSSWDSSRSRARPPAPRHKDDAPSERGARRRSADTRNDGASSSARHGGRSDKRSAHVPFLVISAVSAARQRFWGNQRVIAGFTRRGDSQVHVVDGHGSGIQLMTFERATDSRCAAVLRDVVLRFAYFDLVGPCVRRVAVVGMPASGKRRIASHTIR